MKRFVTGAAVSLVAIAQLASAALAQDASPSAGAVNADPMPYAEYVAALEAFTTDDPFASVSDPPTRDELVAGFEQLVTNATVEQERLTAVVPEDCYAEAHQELLAYWQSSIELTGQVATELAAAATLEGLVSMVNEMDAQLYARHPIAYVESPDGSGGFQGSSFNILDALATCEVAATGSMSPDRTDLESHAP
jgi:hypothetical protein